MSVRGKDVGLDPHMFLTKIMGIILKPIQVVLCAKISAAGILLVGLLNVVGIKIILFAFGGKSASVSTIAHQTFLYLRPKNISTALLVIKVIEVIEI